MARGPIGVFDSGYGGLTILRKLRPRLPQYDYLYFGDNARAPYGTRSFDIVYEFTREAVETLFRMGCALVILACNTASAKALRTIQQCDLPRLDPSRRVLGVIRPTVEALPALSQSRHIGLLATPGTVRSHSYLLETEKLLPDFTLTELACPMWVPIVENGEADGPGADYFVRKYIDSIMEADPLIDTILLGCTHYPLLLAKIRQYLPPEVKVVDQGNLVAEATASYLLRHPGIEARCTHGGSVRYLTTETPEKFDSLASIFMSRPVASTRIEI